MISTLGISSAWLIGFGIGLFALNGFAVLAVLFGWSVEWPGYLLLFFLSFSSAPALVGAVTLKEWVENFREEAKEYRRKLAADAASDAAVTLAETDALAETDYNAQRRAQAIQDGLVDFILWSIVLWGDLTSEAHIKRSVNSVEAWEYWTNLMAANKWVFKTNGVATSWEPNWNPGTVLLSAQNGRFVLPGGDAMPPPVTPCPTGMYVIDETLSAKGKGRKGTERLQKAA